MNNSTNTAQAPGSVLSWQEGISSFGAPPEDPPVVPVAPRTLARLVQAYNEALSSYEESASERDMLNTALLNAQTEQRSVAASLKRLHESFQDAILSPGEPEAKAALAHARAELVDLNERVVALQAKRSRLPQDDYSLSTRISNARDEVLAFVSAEELKAFKPEALAVLHAAWSAQTTQAWADWLPSVLAPPADKGATAQAVMDRHKVVLL
jgi:hypothetical protein